MHKQIQLIDDSLDWIRKNRPEQLEQKFVPLVKMRGRLRQISNAELDNPAVAAYGESQKGKSYLMGNLLQRNGAPFLVQAEDENGKVSMYDFVQKINPIGDKREATGVVTRFTAYSKHPENYSMRYPVRMKVFSVTNLVLILTDGYFNDVMNSELHTEEYFKEKGEEIYRKYINRNDVQDIIIEDDIIDMQDYLKKFVNRLGNVARQTGFFEKLALVIRKIPESDWLDVFSVFWYSEKNGVNEIHHLFSRLLACLSKLEYSRYVYLPIDAVLHNGNNKNTIMSVDCLNGLYGSDGMDTDVFVKNGDGFIRVGTFDKSEISALCCEVAYKVDLDSSGDEENSFFFEEKNAGKAGYMSSSSFQKLSGSGISKKELFLHSDFLDFPGAKNRESLDVDALGNTESKSEQANIIKLLLRGKVAYLFNNYCESKLINILMICHDAEDVKVTSLYKTIEGWVDSYVGKNSEERRRTVELSSGISPLFVVGTKFNIDMMKKGNEDGNNEAALQQRWKGRFSKVLHQDCFHANDVDWFKSWTGKDVAFNNTYILRDFKYSGCNGEGNNLFSGFDASDKCPREKALELPESFYWDLRKSFVEDDNVRQFFDDPALAWDVAATMNNDGSLYIIKNLVSASKSLDAVRTEDFRKSADEVMSSLMDLMSGYYINTDPSSVLPNKITKARAVHREMDFACNADNYFFGHFIHKLQVEYKDIYKVVHDIIQSPELTSSVESWNGYELIRRHLEDCETEDECWNRLIAMYGLKDRDAVKEYLEKKGISPEDVFGGKKHAKKSNSYFIAEQVFVYWTDRLKSPDFLSGFADECGFDFNVMSSLVQDILETASSLDVVGKMSDSIAPYVNVTAVHTANEFAVADLLTDAIDEFVNDLGYEMRSYADIDNCKAITAEYSLPAFINIGKERKTSYDEEELTALFAGLNNDSKSITSSFEAHYNLWIEYMYVSFIGGAEKIPTIDDVAANNAVSGILERIRSI